MIGSGPVAAAHLRFLPAVRDFAELRVGARDPAAAAALARGARRGRAPGIEEAVRGADVVCLCTSASSPVLLPSWLAPGRARHLGRVTRRRAASSIRRSRGPGRLLVETRDAFAPPPAGCAELAGPRPAAPRRSWARSCSGRGPARTSDDELTVYKSMGTVVEDLAAAEVVLARGALARR